MNKCSICLEELTPSKNHSITDCNHTFHTNCLTKWCSTNTCCPFCRTEVYKSEKEIKIYRDPLDTLLDYRMSQIINGN